MIGGVVWFYTEVQTDKAAVDEVCTLTQRETGYFYCDEEVEPDCRETDSTPVLFRFSFGVKVKRKSFGET